MKALTFEQFLTWPSGTLFVKCERGAFHTMGFKGTSIERGDPVGEADEPLYIDFMYEEIIPPLNLCTNELEEYQELIDKHAVTGESLPDIDELPARDGTFDHDCIFLVWEEADIQRLIGRLQGAIPKSDKCDICGEPVEDGHTDVVSGRPRHPTCIPF